LPSGPRFFLDFAESSPALTRIGQPAPAFQAITLEGQAISLEAARGQPLILTFWATWCEPCQAEMPWLEALHQEGLAVVGINAGLETAEAARVWLAAYGIGFPNILDDSDRRLEKLYQVRGLPSTFFIDQDGILRYIQQGVLTPDQLSAGLEAIRPRPSTE
jgi:thiol-disulfide isomerase/thioredoxin